MLNALTSFTFPDILTGSLNVPFASLAILSSENIIGFGLSGNECEPVFEYPIANICMAGGHARLLSSAPTTTMRAWQQDHDIIHIDLTLAESGATRIDVFDLLGRKLRTFVNHELQRGDQHLHYSCSGLSDGCYILQLQTPSETRVSLLQVQR